MLTHLYIKNVALIEEANIEFDEKLNILSGETGSGKSVILDSINFVLGSKADKSMIRYGEQEMMVKAEFSVPSDSDVIKALNDLDIESDGDIIISRRFHVEGKGNIKINGNTVTAAMLKSITQHLVDVHGQSEHFYLLSENNQLSLLDKICGQSLVKYKDELQNLLAKKNEFKKKFSELGGNESERQYRLDFLRHQIDELESANFCVGELDDLLQKQTLMMNVEKIYNSLSSAKASINSEEGAIDQLISAEKQCNNVSHLDQRYADISNRIEMLTVELEDIEQTLFSYLDELTFDEQESARVDDRIKFLKSLLKKYSADEESILQYLDNAKNELKDIQNSAEIVEELNDKLAHLEIEIYSICCKISNVRKEYATALSERIETEIHSLNMPNARFNISFCHYDDKNIRYSAKGADQIEFMFSANKGEPLKSLSKVISGGEMSRFMLALKAQTQEVNTISTLIFDEIDAGISGYTAKTVAQKFRNISDHCQIIAVSHLPQVCASADSQFLIYKIEESDKTVTKIKKLTYQERIDEIIRLAGSVSSDTAKSHAIELLNEYH